MTRVENGEGARPPMRVAVLHGGDSDERDLSLASGAAVAETLLARGDRVSLVDPLGGVTQVRTKADLPRVELALEPSEIPPAPGRGRCFEVMTSAEVAGGLRQADVVFVALTGGWGGDGHIQALLDLMEVRYTGPGAAAASHALDKLVARRLLHAAGVPIAPAVAVSAALSGPRGRAELRAAADLLRQGPAVAKPVRGGGSLHVELVRTVDELHALLAVGPGDLLVERYLPGREFTVGIVGDRALPIMEVTPPTALFAYGAKRLPALHSRKCPAPIPAGDAAVLRSLALRAHRAIGLDHRCYSRVDLRCDGTGAPYCLEVNALPGLTEISMFPQAAATAGWSFTDLITTIIGLTLAPRTG
ncbi:D-alanine--D-alanine ligase [Actinomadura darangshiensis]|uniref:D-alanine--D-alanine ligase n=1 Tax=Actinomadura darangshiensis TaxID=705336 RepID=A0A4R5ARK7_9ACTN|nr:D-alanine--D-alanine ligase [Actinomadura darangshiensis]TDD74326.1 D-alanine--D-alanine ligase [Actinomadura darangshiensis]